MATEANRPANKNAEGSCLTMVPVEGDLRAVQTLETVDEEHGGFESARKAGEPAAPQADLKEGDFAEEPEGSEVSEEKSEADSAASHEQSEADSNPVNPVIYHYDNDAMEGESIGYSIDTFDVSEMGREHYALVGPTAHTGGTLVCAMVALVPGNPDLYGMKETWVLKRTDVCLMARGKDMHFIYATMDSSQYEGEGQTEITT